MCCGRLEDVIYLLKCEEPETAKHFAIAIARLSDMNYSDVTVEELDGLLAAPDLILIKGIKLLKENSPDMTSRWMIVLAELSDHSMDGLTVRQIQEAMILKS